MEHDIIASAKAGAAGVVLGVLALDGSVDLDSTGKLIKLARTHNLEITFHRAIDMTVSSNLSTSARLLGRIHAACLNVKAAHLAHPLIFEFLKQPDVEVAMKHCIELGVDRVLTSGGCASAAAGTDTIQRLVNLSCGSNVQVVAGGGISETNVKDLVSKTGVSAVHGSLRTRYSLLLVLPPLSCAVAVVQYNLMRAQPPIHDSPFLLSRICRTQFRRAGVFMGAAKVNNESTEFEIKQVDPVRVANVVRALAPAPVKIVLDFSRVDTLDDLWDEINSKIGFPDFGRNLDALVDLLRGGFGHNDQAAGQEFALVVVGRTRARDRVSKWRDVEETLSDSVKQEYGEAVASIEWADSVTGDEVVN